MKVKVKILDSIAGLADPKPKTDLDEKYRRAIQAANKGRPKEMSKQAEEVFIAQMKDRDRYGEKPIGFPRDWAFKPGDEPMVEQDLAEKWETAGICTILATDERSKKAA